MSLWRVELQTGHHVVTTFYANNPHGNGPPMMEPLGKAMDACLDVFLSGSAVFDSEGALRVLLTRVSE